jgi:hypothetical protein
MSFQRDALGVHDVEMLLDVLTGRALLLVNGPSLERHACVPHHDNGGRVLTLPEVDTGDEGFIGGRRRAEGESGGWGLSIRPIVHRPNLEGGGNGYRP